MRGVLAVIFVLWPASFLMAAREAHATTAESPRPALAANSIFPTFSPENALAEEAIDAEDLRKMRLGQVVVKIRELPAGWKGTNAAAMAFVSGTPAQVMAVILDCAAQPQFVPHLEECRNLYAPGDDPARATEFRQYQRLRIGLGFLYKEIRYTNQIFVLHPFVTAWQLSEGDLKKGAGYWRIIPFQADKQILVYNVFHQPGMAVPTWVQDILLNSDLPQTVKAFRDRVEGSAAPAK